MKKLLSILLASALMATLLSSCGQSSKGNSTGASAAGNAAAGAEQVFELAHTATEANQVALLEGMFGKFVSDYNAANGTNYVFKLSSAQSKDIINTRMSSKDKPDLFILDSPADVAQYVKDDLLLDMTAFADAQKWEDKMFSWAYSLSKVNGKVYTMPYGYEGIVLWYNKNIMSELGLKEEDLKDLATFEGALQKAQDAGYTPIMLGTQDWPWAQEWYLSIMYSYTGRELLRDTLTGQNDAKWTDDRFATTVQLYKDWHDKGYLADGKSYTLTSDDAINAFTNDKALFKLEGTWAPYWITPLDQEVKDKIGVMIHPAINSEETSHIPIAVGGMWSASKDTDAPELVGYIMEQLLSQDIQSDFLKAGLDVAPIEIDPAEFNDLDPVVKDMWLMLNDSLANGEYGYTTYAFYPPETRVYAYEGIVNVMEGKITVEEYLARMQELNDKEREAGFVPILP